MSAETGLVRALTRERWIVGACLALACLFAWSWLFWQARQMSEPPAAMGDMGGMAAMATMGPAPGTIAYMASAFMMWALMMVAMMLPSAAPMILAYVRISGDTRREAGALVPSFLFAGLYLAMWTAFALVAATVQSLLAQAGAISAAKLAVGDARLASVLLIAAGLYQVTPIKRVCLAQCRSPASFLMREWRPGWGGSIRLGVLHGLYCLGCCWLLMALLFIGGVMNLAWVALLAALVLAERVLPIGERAALAIGGLAIAAGFAVLLAPDLMGLRT
jgi:predicted metal-binding membrane protein